MTDGTMNEVDAEAVISRIERLRQNGERAETASFPALPNLDQAMDLQAQIRLDAEAADAWKVARAPDGSAVVARLHPLIEKSTGAILPWREGTLLEIEIAIRLGRDLPPSGSYDRATLVEAIEVVHLGAELVRSVLIEGGKVSFPLFLADRLGNDGYILGPQLDRGFLDPQAEPGLRIGASGRAIFDNRARHATGDVLSWLLEFANRQDRAAASLTAGTLITTGSLCGAIPLSGGGLFDVALDGAPVFGFSLD